MSVAENAGAKQQKPRGRPFAKGQSGNPSGKPKGCRNRAGVLLDAITDDDLAAIIATLIMQARFGDMTAIKILFDRLVPTRRTRAVVLDLPDLRDGTARSAARAHYAVLQAVADGTLDPNEGEALGRLVEAASKAAGNSGGC